MRPQSVPSDNYDPGAYHDDQLLLDASGSSSSAPTVSYDRDGYPRYIVPPGGRPTTPSSFYSSAETPSTAMASWSSTMERRAFREDEGRLYQAQNDDYVLPADQKEMSRLDHQHYGCKLFQKGKNYVVPMDKVLENRGEGRRGLDVGCGTGVWVIEMAREFDKAEWVGVDLAPIQTDSDLPDNLTFIHEDAVRGLPYPDEYFDLIHCRVLYMGIRNWKDLVDEVARLLRPGGMAVFVEVEGRWSLHEKTREEEIKIAPGFSKFCDYLAMATEKRGLDVDAAKTNIVKYIRQNGTLEDVEQLRMFIPLSPWSDEPHMKASGKIMLVDAIEIPDAVRHLILDAAEISPSKFEELKKGWIDDVHNPSCHVGAYYWHNTARKKLHSVDEESLLKNDVQE